MTNEITITLPRHAIHRVVAKLLLILAVGLLSGYLYDQTVAPDNAEAQELTLDEYTANFETYKANLPEEDLGLGAHLALFVLVFGFVFGIYEAIAWGLATLFGHIRGIAPKPPT